MRNIMTLSEYTQKKENITQKMKENNVSEAEAKEVLESNLPKSDNYQSRLLKLIPTEIVGVYIFINGLLPVDPVGNKYIILQWIIFGLLFIINPLYLRYASAVTNKKQIVICTVGFCRLGFLFGQFIHDYRKRPNLFQITWIDHPRCLHAHCSNVFKRSSNAKSKFITYRYAMYCIFVAIDNEPLTNFVIN